MRGIKVTESRKRGIKLNIILQVQGVRESRRCGIEVTEARMCGIDLIGTGGNVIRRTNIYLQGGKIKCDLRLFIPIKTMHIETL